MLQEDQLDVARARDYLRTSHATQHVTLPDDVVYALSEVGRKLPKSVADGFARWAMIAADLNDATFSSLFAEVSQAREATDVPGQCRIHLVGAHDVSWELTRTDDRLPCVAVDTPASGESGGLIATVKPGSYAVAFTTSDNGVTVEVPLYVERDSTEIRLDVTACVYPPPALSFETIVVPTSSGPIGGDLLARNSVERTTERIPTMVVGRTHLTVGDYLSFGGDPGLPHFEGHRLLDDTGQPTEHLHTDKNADPMLLPVVGLSWEEVAAFLALLSLPEGWRARLLTSDEWELLARGPECLIYPWGNDWVPGAANVLVAPGAETGLEHVGARPLDVSRWGLLDCAGNVEEWTAGPDEAVPIARGGCWYNDRQIARCASRVDRRSNFRHTKLGFRVALERQPSG